MEPIGIGVIIFSGLIAVIFIGFVCYNMCIDCYNDRKKNIETENYGKHFIENNEYNDL